jgi:holo-[acyl-carrier protein] synthase
MLYFPTSSSLHFRFAAKEAVIKAHPHRRLTFQSIAILRMALGTSLPESEDTLEQLQEPATDPGEGKSPDASVSRSGALVALIKAEGTHGDDTYASVSISHDTEYATAVCLGVNPESSLMLQSSRDR